MKTLLRIIIISSLLVLGSCSTDELHIPEKGRQVEFVVRQTSFIGVDVSSVSTKALTAAELTETESRIASLYFLVFDEAGNRIEDEFIALDPASQMSRTIYGRGPLTVCYLANVPYSYANSITHIDRLKDTPLPITYAPETETGYIGIPQMTLDLNRDGADETATRCFPMIGMETYPGAEVTSDVVEIDLKRVFSKVVVRLRTDFDADWGALFDAPEINLYSYTLYNLPTNVMLSPEAMTDSPWVGYPDTQSGRKYFEEPKEVDMDDITVNNSLILQTYTTVLTCYIPEYYLSPKSSAASNTDQRLKPQMYDLTKRPVYLTINAHTHQSNFVDVPLKYYLYFGENAVNDFNLLRNCQYNNNMTITGTGDAILGTDERVEAAYHNLANPDNSGVDVPANCYIISKPGRYLIPTYMGNKVSGGTQIGGASVDAPVHLSGNTATDKITNVRFLPANHEDNTLGQDCIMFDVNMYDSSNAFSPADVVGSNKLICLKNSAGQIIWSWHLWLCDDNNRPDEYSHIYPETESVVMNRALGSLNNLGLEGFGISMAYWDDGLYYQWGRKDPFLQSGNTASSSGSYAKGKQNPRTFYTDWKGKYTTENSTDAIGWTSAKSVNDPCPPGYKVPSNEIWRATPSSSDGMENIMEGLGNIIPGLSGYPYNYNASLDISHNVMYPYSGYLNNGVIDGVSSKTFTNRVATRTPVSGMEVRVVFSGTDYVYSGELWSYTGGLYFSRSKTDITKSDIYVKVNSTWYPRTPDNNNPNGYTVGNIETSLLSSFGSGFLQQIAKAAVQAVLSLLKSTLGFTLDGFIESTLESMVTVRHEYGRKLQSDADAIPLSHGVHVRCVKE